MAPAAILAGANDLRAIWRRARRPSPEALEAFGVAGGRAPCHSGFHCILKSLDADALARALGGNAPGGREPGHVAVDGKTLRGSRRSVGADGGEERALHVLSAFADGLNAVVGDLAVPPDGNEIVAAVELPKNIPPKGAVITGDAIFARRETSRCIVENGGDWLFSVKGNRPTLHRGIALAFGDARPGDPCPSAEPPPDMRTAETVDADHGRVEIRRIAVSSEAVPRLDWPGPGQIARLERTRIKPGGEETVRVDHLITGLPPGRADAGRLLAIARARRGIENRLHRVRDVTFDEDRCRCRLTGRALAALKNEAIRLIRNLGLPLPEAREDFREFRAEAIWRVTGVLL